MCIYLYVYVQLSSQNKEQLIIIKPTSFHKETFFIRKEVANQIQQHTKFISILKRLYTMTKWHRFLECKDGST